MNILCIYTNDSVIFDRRKPKLLNPSLLPFGISYIATVLKSDGNKVKMLLLSRTIPFEDILTDTLKTFDPDIVCFTSVATQFEFVKELSSFIKQFNSRIYLILGGVYATLQPEEAMQCKAFDALCVGEGESPIIELVHSLQNDNQPTNIQNLWIRKSNGEIEKNPTRAFISNLDELPYIDRAMWRDSLFTEKGRVSLLVGRGCPNKCAYCSNHMLAKSSSGRYIRFRSPENIIGELNEISKWYPETSNIYLEVETLSANVKYLFTLCDALSNYNQQRKQPLQFGVNFSLNNRLSREPILITDILSAFKQAGVSYINIGLESGSERVRKEILRRPHYSNDSIIKFCNIARDYSNNVTINVLIGIPGESHEDFQQTIKVTRECNPQDLNYNIMYPYPGTEIYTLAKEKGYIIETDDILERKQSNLNLPSFSSKLINREYVLFYFKIFYGRKPLHKLIRKTLISYLYQNAPDLTNALRKIKHFIQQF
jgi:radical SAM superfamily enzyme YgiQ (UPF0313 family)